MTLVTRKPNPNTAWIEHSSGWVAYLFVIVLARLVITYIPFISSEWGWTLTNLFHNIVRCVARGAPWPRLGPAQRVH